MRRSSLPFWLLVVVLLLTLVSTMTFDRGTAEADQPPPPDTTLDEPGSPIVATTLGQLPLSFVPNAGQADAAVRFQAHPMGGTVAFSPAEIVLSLPSPAQIAAHRRPGGGRPEDLGGPGRAGDRVPAHVSLPEVVRLRFEGAAPPSEIASIDPLPGTANYFLGNDPAKWRTNLPTFAGIVYRGIYPGIDVRYEGSGDHLKSTYVVAPGADPSLIRWRYHGAAAGHLDQQGNFHVTLPISATRSQRPDNAGPPQAPELIEHTPEAWQEIGGQRVTVSVGYVLNADGTTSFQVGAYDPAYPLILDPTLTYSTYVGGSEYDEGVSATVDSLGASYIVGKTLSTNFPRTAAYDNTHNGDYDVFVTKLNPRGTARVFSTYLGGSRTDIGYDVDVDSSGNVFVGGRTYKDASTDIQFPTTAGAYDEVHSGQGDDAFVVKLAPSGSSLTYSTLVGGTGGDTAYGLALNPSGNAYIVGVTTGDFPATPGAYDTTQSALNDAFVAKLSVSGSALNYATVLGSGYGDVAYDVVVDGAANAYVTGVTTSPNFPTTAGVLDSSLTGGQEAFVAKFNSTLSTLVYSTFLGGNDLDGGKSIALGSSGRVYITGYTSSTEGFPTLNGRQQSLGGGYDAFVTKLNGSGTAVLYSTYLGGSGSDEGYEIAVDAKEYASVTGYTASTNNDFPVDNALYATFRGGAYDAFVTTVNTKGDQFVHSTYLGGSGDELGNGITVDQWGHVYVTGYTSSGNSSFPRANPMDRYYNGLVDAFVSKIEVQSTLLGWFLREPNWPEPTAYPTAPVVAQRSDLVILSKRSRNQEYLNTLRGYGYHGLELQYVRANEIQKVLATVTGTPTPPSNNQWAYVGPNSSLVLPDPTITPTAYEGDYQWINDHHPEWFLGKKVNGVCSRLDTGDGYYHMDPGDPGWRAWVADRATWFVSDTDGRGAYGFDGLYLDNVDVGWGGLQKKAYGSSTANQPLYKCKNASCSVCGGTAAGDVYETNAEYVSAVAGFTSAIRTEVNALGTPTPPQLWGNMIGDPNTGSSWQPFMEGTTNSLDGGLFEAWVTGYCPPEPGATPAAACDDQDNHAIDDDKANGVLKQAWWAVTHGKRFIGVGQGLHPSVTSDAGRQRFALASYLLVVPAQNRAQAMFRYTNHYDVNGDGAEEYEEWWFYDNYNDKLGAPLGTAYSTSTGCSGITLDNVDTSASAPDCFAWRRDFRNGYVTVNVDTRTGTIVANP